MATRVAASILGWKNRVGTMEEGKLADLVVASGSATKPDVSLSESTEADARFVINGGIRQFEVPKLIAGTGTDLETIAIGKKARALNLGPDQGQDDGPQVQQLMLGQDTAALHDALTHLGKASPAIPHLRELAAAITGGRRLALDDLENAEFRTVAGFPAKARNSALTRPLAANSTIGLGPIALDPLTVPDNAGFLAALAKGRNLPVGLAAGVAQLY